MENQSIICTYNGIFMIDSDIYKSLRNVPISAMELAEVIGKK